MRLVPRVVFDTSTLVGAVLRPTSIPNMALHKAFQSFAVCASPETLEELRIVLERDKFRRYLDLDQCLEFFVTYSRAIVLFDILPLGEATPPCRDEKDRKFLELAMVCKAEWLISSDEDLLCLDPWRGIPIVTPAVFLALPA